MVWVAVVRAQHPQLHLEYVTHEAESERTRSRVYVAHNPHNQKLLGITSHMTGCSLTLSGIAPSRSHGPGLDGSDAGRELSLHIILKRLTFLL